MNNMRIVAWYGDAVALSSIAAGMEGCAGLRAVPANGLGDLEPDAIVFDLTALCPEAVKALCKSRSCPLLIGVDLVADRAVVFSGRSMHALTLETLVDAIDSAKEAPSVL